MTRHRKSRPSGRSDPNRRQNPTSAPNSNGNRRKFARGGGPPPKQHQLRPQKAPSRNDRKNNTNSRDRNRNQEQHPQWGGSAAPNGPSAAPAHPPPSRSHPMKRLRSTSSVPPHPVQIPVPSYSVHQGCRPDPLGGQPRGADLSSHQHHHSRQGEPPHASSHLTGGKRARTEGRAHRLNAPFRMRSSRSRERVDRDGVEEAVRESSRSSRTSNYSSGRGKEEPLQAGEGRGPVFLTKWMEFFPDAPPLFHEKTATKESTSSVTSAAVFSDKRHREFSSTSGTAVSEEEEEEEMTVQSESSRLSSTRGSRSSSNGSSSSSVSYSYGSYTYYSPSGSSVLLHKEMQSTAMPNTLEKDEMTGKEEVKGAKRSETARKAPADYTASIQETILGATSGPTAAAPIRSEEGGPLKNRKEGDSVPSTNTTNTSSAGLCFLRRRLMDLRAQLQEPKAEAICVPDPTPLPSAAPLHSDRPPQEGVDPDRASWRDGPPHNDDDLHLAAPATGVPGASTAVTAEVERYRGAAAPPPPPLLRKRDGEGSLSSGLVLPLTTKAYGEPNEEEENRRPPPSQASSFSRLLQDIELASGASSPLCSGLPMEKKKYPAADEVAEGGEDNERRLEATLRKRREWEVHCRQAATLRRSPSSEDVRRPLTAADLLTKLPYKEWLRASVHLEKEAAAGSSIFAVHSPNAAPGNASSEECVRGGKGISRFPPTVCPTEEDWERMRHSLSFSLCGDEAALREHLQPSSPLRWSLYRERLERGEVDDTDTPCGNAEKTQTLSAAKLPETLDAWRENHDACLIAEPIQPYSLEGETRIEDMTKTYLFHFHYGKLHPKPPWFLCTKTVDNCEHPQYVPWMKEVERQVLPVPTPMNSSSSNHHPATGERALLNAATTVPSTKSSTLPPAPNPTTDATTRNAMKADEVTVYDLVLEGEVLGTVEEEVQKARAILRQKGVLLDAPPSEKQEESA